MQPAVSDQPTSQAPRCPADPADVCGVALAGQLALWLAPQASLDYEGLTVTHLGGPVCFANWASNTPRTGPRLLVVPWGWDSFSWERLDQHSAASVPWRASRARALVDRARMFRARALQTIRFVKYWTPISWGTDAPHAKLNHNLCQLTWWHKRARQTVRTFRQSDGVWHRQRAASLEVTIKDKVWFCNGTSVWLLDPVSGNERQIDVPCNDRTCPNCAARRGRKAAAQLFTNLQRVTKCANKEAGGARKPQLLSFTVRHCGDTTTDARRLQLALCKFRSSWCSYQNRKWKAKYGVARKSKKNPNPKKPTAKKWRLSFDYVRVLEVAPGGKRKGHAHFHMIAWLPKWWPWADAQRWWRKALYKADAELGVVYETQEMRDSPGNIDIDPNSGIAAMNGYITKVTNYVSKYGLDILSCTPEAGAGIADGLYGRRWITTSRGLFVRPLPQEWQVVTLPDRPVRWEHWHMFAPREWSSTDTTGPPA